MTDFGVLVCVIAWYSLMSVGATLVGLLIDVMRIFASKK
jgi:hypothetical protein